MLYVLFFASGFAALLYQVVWQRTLFSLYGINMESVTMVVTVFMLGLGVGSLLGGRLSQDERRPSVLYFSLAEIAIGVFGVLSLFLFREVGARTARLSPPLVVLVSFLLLLVPTLLMGSTLPLLTSHFVRKDRNVGKAVGNLYAINTLGSACASLTSVFVLLGELGQQGTVFLAGGLNFFAGALAYAEHQRKRRSA